VANGTLARGVLDMLGRAVAARCTLLICGGTGSGKTTTLGALASFVDPAERVVTIEDAAELKLPLPHVVRLEARPPNLEGRGEVTIRRLVRNALRMRPDRLIVGEVRGPEALDLLVALSTGHAGSLCTIHAGSAAEALRRLETLALMADVGLPLAAIRDQIADAIDLVVRQERGADGARRVVEVAEVVRAAGAPAIRELLTLRAGRAVARAPISDALAARLAPGAPGLHRVAAATPPGAHGTAAPAGAQGSAPDAQGTAAPAGAHGTAAPPGAQGSAPGRDAAPIVPPQADR
jgi:pilus assembly protein CpaF